MDAAPSRSLHPSIFLLLNLPGGIAMGVITVVLPFLITRAGLSVGTAAWVVAVGLAPMSLRVLWAPLADLTLTYKAWYRIGAALSAAMLLVLSMVPIAPLTVGALAPAAFTMKAGVTLTQLPGAGLMALAVPHRLQGRAAAFFQVGAKIGTGLAGGGGVWLASHTGSPLAGGAVLAVACLECVGALAAVQEPERAPRTDALQTRLADIGRDLWAIVRARRGAFVLALVLKPIGAGAAGNLWSAVATEWHTTPDTVALVTGIGTTVVAALGCLLAGWWGRPCRPARGLPRRGRRAGARRCRPRRRVAASPRIGRTTRPAC
jgi:MFS family permease